MRHPLTTALHAHWNKLRGSRPAPDRAEFDPRDMAGFIANTFIVETEGVAPFRLAGSKLCALFGNELKGRSFLALFDVDDRLALADTMEQARRCTAPLILSVDAETATGHHLPLEFALLPMASNGTVGTRYIGAFGVFGDDFWAGRDTVVSIKLKGMRYLIQTDDAAELDHYVHPLVAVAGVPTTPRPRANGRPFLSVLRGGRA